MRGGNLSIDQPFQLQSGTLAGTNTVTGSVTNNGTVSPGASPGQLKITGNYTQTTNGALLIELAGTSPGTNFDRLLVGGTATLAGALNIALTNGFYPATNAAFTFLTNATRSGTFAAFNYPSNDVGMQISYAPTNATIQVINVRPVLVFSNQTNDELALFNLNGAGTDDDLPPQTLTYALINSPIGATINSSSGLISWTPTEAQGPLTTNITVLVTDNGTPNLTVSRTFQIVVNEINVAPELTLPPNQTFNEQTAFNASATATDSDIPVNTLTFELVSGPAGLTVATNGAIAWQPTEAQGPNAYPVTVRVTDNNTNAVNPQQLSTTNSFTLTVNEVNLPPVLTVPTNQVLIEETTLSVSASATDPDFPANGLSFALLSPPGGMTINSESGAISWTPDETQGSNFYTINVVITDDNPAAINSQHLSVTNSFSVTVNESNRPPVLTVPDNQVITEEVALNVSAFATDPDSPANPLTFALISPPEGMTIDANSGAIAWTPTEAQGSNFYTITVTVSDTNATAINAKQLSVTNTFTVTVNESNRPPVLTLPTNQTINELTSLSTNATATDPDLPANALTFALVSGPSGLTVSSNGTISWTPGEADGPGTNTVFVKVSDSNPFAINANSLSVTSSFQIVVNERNVAPVPGPIADRTVNPGQTISFTATATDADLPTNGLSFSLVNPPVGATISGGGAFQWRPSVAQADTTNQVFVRVEDNGSPALSGTNSFMAVVNPLSPVLLTPLSFGGGAFTFQVSGTTGPDYFIMASTNLTDWLDIGTNLSAVTPFQFNDAAAGTFTNRSYRVRLGP